MASVPLPTCCRCEKPTAARCQICKASFCGTECYHLSYKPHRTVCKPLVDRFSAEHRPSASHVRVVLLRPGFAAPKWEWYDRQPADWFDYDAECAKAKAASGDPGNLIASSVRAIVSDHAYYRAHGTDVLVVGRWSPADTLNRCIKALAPSGELFPWRGQLVCFSFRAQKNEAQSLCGRHVSAAQLNRYWDDAVDMTVNEIHRVFDHFRWHLLNSVLVGYERYPGPVLYAHRLLCWRDLEIHAGSPIRPARIRHEVSQPPFRKIFDMPVTARLGVPLRFYTFGSLYVSRRGAPALVPVPDSFKSPWRHCPEVMPKPLHNYLAGPLLIERPKGFGPPPESTNIVYRDDNEYGNLVVWRADGMKLPWYHLKAMECFILWAVQGTFPGCLAEFRRSPLPYVTDETSERADTATATTTATAPRASETKSTAYSTTSCSSTPGPSPVQPHQMTTLALLNEIDAIAQEYQLMAARVLTRQAYEAAFTPELFKEFWPLWKTSWVRQCPCDKDVLDRLPAPWEVSD